MNHNRQSIITSMQLLIELAKSSDKIKLGQISELLSNKRYPALLVIFSLPFCFPIQIPGFSTPFGIILAFLGFRMACAQKVWWPKWLSNKELYAKHVTLFAEKVMQISNKLSKIVHPRLLFFINQPYLYRLHGVLIFFLGMLLALPLPIPFSNLLTATPIFLIGLGLLEDDGGAILIAYLIALVCFLAFFAFYLISKAQLTSL